MLNVGELKETKAYKKWAKTVSETKPPTSPLRRREKKYVTTTVVILFPKSHLLIQTLNTCVHVTGQRSQTLIYMQSYLSDAMQGKTSLTPCFHLWFPNTVERKTAAVQNPLTKNSKLHRKGWIRLETPLRNLGSSSWKTSQSDYLVPFMFYFCHKSFCFSCLN